MNLNLYTNFCSLLTAQSALQHLLQSPVHILEVLPCSSEAIPCFLFRMHHKFLCSRMEVSAFWNNLGISTFPNNNAMCSWGGPGTN